MKAVLSLLVMISCSLAHAGVFGSESSNNASQAAENLFSTRLQFIQQMRVVNQQGKDGKAVIAKNFQLISMRSENLKFAFKACIQENELDKCYQEALKASAHKVQKLAKSDEAAADLLNVAMKEALDKAVVDAQK